MPWDTTADIKVDSRILINSFGAFPAARCNFGLSVRIGYFTVWPPKTEPGKGRFPKIALDAVEHVVCVDLDLPGAPG